jgi:hypothetical protein
MVDQPDADIINCIKSDDLIKVNADEGIIQIQ